MTTYTIVHVVISAIGIGSGLVVVAGLLAAKRFDRWSAMFLASTIATSVTGFGFPFERLLPSHVVGVISLVVLAIAVFARYTRGLDGPWRWIDVVTAVVALYLNVFVLIVQAFRNVPTLTVLAPTQSEPPFAVAQLTVLLLFIALGIAASIRFRIEPARSTSAGRGSAAGV